VTAPDQQQVIADALAAHLYGDYTHAYYDDPWSVYPPVRCRCGWRRGGSHFEHVAAAILEALAASNAATDPADGQAANEGCGCTELCAMGPTCPGGMLARLPGSGCWRSSADGQAVAEGLSEDEIRVIGTRLAGVMDGAVDDAARWLAPTVEAILAARRGQHAERALERVLALADEIERQSQICDVGNTATIAARLRAAAGGTP
jgi:hypothetical protein